MSCKHPSRMIEPVVRLGNPALSEPISETFGQVVVCVSCKAAIGDVKLLAKGHPKTFNKTSWALMLQVHARPPYVFKLDAAGRMLIPETYDEEAHKS